MNRNEKKEKKKYHILQLNSKEYGIWHATLSKSCVVALLKNIYITLIFIYLIFQLMKLTEG